MPISIQKFTFNPFQENTYVLHDSKSCVIIDPGCYDREEQEVLVQFIDANQLKPEAILLTHAHLDHIFGVDFLQKHYGLDCYIHEKDLFTLQMGERSAALYGIPGFVPPAIPNKLIQAGDLLTFGSMSFKVLFTPGHCVGHVVFYNAQQQFVINGDVLFAGSYGRTDLPGGDLEVLKDSIFNVLFKLPEDTTVYCGHGPETTIGKEKRTNYILNS